MKLLDLLKIQKERSGSDLHLAPGYPPLCRIQGEMKPIADALMTHEQTTMLVYEILSPFQKDAFEKTRDLDFAYEAPELEARFRVNVFYGRLGLSAVFRLIPTHILSADQLRLPESILEFARQKKGLVVVTGATGSGKSTTLAAMVDYINRTRKEHILTIEDPIEFIHSGHLSLISQREVGVHSQSFATALRAALREDPDVILMGEMRDLETIQLAVTAAETGHLVLATLHTSTAAQTVDRLVNVFPVGQQAQIRLVVSGCLRGIVAQNLVKTIDGKRAAAFEVLVNTPAISNLIREGRAHQIPSSMQTGKEHGMVMMDDSLRALVSSGRVALSEAMKFASPAYNAQSSGRPSSLRLQRLV